MLPVSLRLRGGIDAAQAQMVERTVKGIREVRRRIGCGEMNRQLAAREFHGDGGSKRRLADAAFSHHHDQAMFVPGDFIDQCGQIGRAGKCLRSGDGSAARLHGIE